eukprot:TRINITY_DN12563_c1_g1_i1.p1 TRINITY_DN12563_c1_g1~~TRINITY_DN12563_c1_g1_i1.p1  ORF type:complete len:704 (+),score=237.13 TRINITY_DN12563_c1_g1_i1:121-2112(+)
MTQANMEYLKAHQLHRLVDQLVQSLVQAHPERPREYIADFLRKHLASRAPASGDAAAPAPSPAAAPAAAPAPAPAPAPAAAPEAAPAPAEGDAGGDGKTQVRKKARQRTQTMLKNDTPAAKPTAPVSAAPDPAGPKEDWEKEMDTAGTEAAAERMDKRGARRKAAAAARERNQAGKEAADERTKKRDERRRAAAAAREKSNRRASVSDSGTGDHPVMRKASRARSASGLKVHDRDLAEAPPKEPRRLSQRGSDGGGGGEWTAEKLQKHACEEVLKPQEDKVKFHRLFYSCAASRKRPAAYLNAWSMLAYSAEAAQARWEATKGSKHPEAVYINYDLSVYERVIVVFTEDGPINPDPEEMWPFDDFVAYLCDTKGTYCEDPVRDKEVSRCGDKLEPLCKQAVHVTMQGWRSTQEDAHLHLRLGPDLAVFAVFDGHGGTLASQWVAQELPEYLREAGVTEATSVEDIPARVRAAIEKCDEELENTRSVECGTVGATCCMVLITPTHYVCCNIGDSRAVLCRKGEAIALSRDHTLDDEEECSRVTAAGYEVRNNRIEGMLSVPRAFGDFDFKQCGGKGPEAQAVSVAPENKIIERSPDDEFILVACDGIWDGFDNEEAVEFVLEKRKEDCGDEQIVCAMMDANLPSEIDEEAIGTDNQTCILVTLQ